MMAQSDQETLAEFCAQLQRLRGLFRHATVVRKQAMLEEAVLAARAGKPVGPLLNELYEDDDDLDSADDVPDSPPMSALPTVAYVAPSSGIYVCPRSVCTRVDNCTAGSPIPACHVHEQALRFVFGD
jgi:hypothetical protein